MLLCEKKVNWILWGYINNWNVYEGYFKLLECIVLSFVDDKFNFL